MVWSEQDKRGLERVGRALAARNDSLTDEMIDRIRAEVPAYSRLGPETFARIHVLASATALSISTALLTHTPVRRGDIPIIREQAADRLAAGIDLDSFLHAYRAALFFYWDVAMDEAARLRLSRGVSHTVGRFVLDSIDTITTHAAEAYLREDNRRRNETGRAMADLIDNLLAGRPIPPGRSPVAPGLNPTRPVQVIIARVASSDGDVTTALGTALELLEASLSLGTARPLSTIRHRELVMIAPGSPPISRLHSAARCAREQQGIHLRISASDAASGFRGIPDAYTEAALSLSYAGPERPVVTQAELSVLQLLLLGSADTTRELIRQKAAALEALPEKDRAVTADTVRAFVAANMRIAEAAAVLHVHPNTVRYRLAKIATDTGLDPQTFTGLVDLSCIVELAVSEASAGRS